MQCTYHPKTEAEFSCAICNAPLCRECAEEVRPGHYCCLRCAMLQSVSEAGTSIQEKRERQEERREKTKWGPFQYFVILSSVSILLMWGVIIFGGQKPPPRTADFAKSERVLLFMVDSAIKRYANYERNKYPEQLTDLIPKYLPQREDEVFNINHLSYKRDLKVGYRLHLAASKPGQMSLVLTANGVEYTPPPREKV